MAHHARQDVAVTAVTVLRHQVAAAYLSTVAVRAAVLRHTAVEVVHHTAEVRLAVAHAAEAAHQAVVVAQAHADAKD